MLLIFNSMKGGINGADPFWRHEYLTKDFYSHVWKGPFYLLWIESSISLFSRDFNKREEDFGCLRDYNNYLEMVEDIIFNLSNNIDVTETNKKIQVYKEVNKEQILRNRWALILPLRFDVLYRYPVTCHYPLY